MSTTTARRPKSRNPSNGRTLKSSKSESTAAAAAPNTAQESAPLKVAEEAVAAVTPTVSAAVTPAENKRKRVKVPTPLVEPPAALESAVTVEPAESADPTAAVDDTRRRTGRRKGLPDVASVLAHTVELLDQVQNRTGQTKGVTRILKKAKANCKTMDVIVTRLTVKEGSKKAPKSRQNSGIMKKSHITPELAEFAQWSNDELKSRTDVTKMVCAYVKQQGLQYADDKRLVVLDVPLRTLLRVPDTEGPIPYCNLQKYFNHLFVKSEAVVA